MAVLVVEPLEVVDVAQHHGKRFAVAAELRTTMSHFVVKRAAVGQARQGIGAGLGGVRLHQPRLLLQFHLGGVELLLHLLIGFNQLGHGGNHRLGFTTLDGAQLLVDLLHPAAMRAHVGGNVRGQLLQT